MAVQKEQYSAEEVEHLINEARGQMELEFLKRDFGQHKETTERSQAEINAKLEVIMKTSQERSEELTKFRLGLKQELEEDFVTKKEFQGMKRSIVLAVAFVVGVGGVIQWVLTATTMVSQLMTMVTP
jgi:hypothetical protein